MIVATRNLQGRSTEELGSGGYWWVKRYTVYSTHVVSDEVWVDVGVWI